MPTISVMVEGGKASAGAPLGPALGPLGINIGEVIKQINEQTKDFAGMKVPVKVVVDSAKKTFEVQVGSPPMSALIKKEAGLEKASKDSKREFAGNISFSQAVSIAKKKAASLTSYNLKSNVKEVLGTCNAMGITVEGKRGSEIIAEIDAGKYDAQLK
ncbi:MAG: 50S ribosomal protein L11 [Candidatus Diapherotrites archaeon]